MFWVIASTIIAVAVVMAAPVAAQSPIEFRCPPEGIAAEYSNNMRVASVGNDPIDPTVCVMETTPVGSSDSARTRFLYQFVLPDERSQQFNVQRQAMAALYPAVAGRSTEYAWRPSTGPRAGQIYTETWTIIGQESVTVKAGTFNALVFDHTRSNSWFRATWRRWVDLDSRLIIKQTYNNVRGSALIGQEWEAVKLTSPTPAAPPPASAPSQRPRR